MPTITKAVLRQALQDTGDFSYREARKIVNLIVDEFTKILKQHGVLELPFGTLTVLHPKTGRAYRLGKIVRTGRKTKVHFKKKLSFATPRGFKE